MSISTYSFSVPTTVNGVSSAVNVAAADPENRTIEIAGGTSVDDVVGVESTNDGGTSWQEVHRQVAGGTSQTINQSGGSWRVRRLKGTTALVMKMMAPDILLSPTATLPRYDFTVPTNVGEAGSAVNVAAADPRGREFQCDGGASSDVVAIESSPDGGTSWVEIDRIRGSDEKRTLTHSGVSYRPKRIAGTTALTLAMFAPDLRTGGGVTGFATGGALSQIDVGDAAAAGTATTAARGDHQHALPAPAAPADVTKAAAAAGVATTVARADHKHDISTAAASGLSSNSNSSEGSATSLARSDHTHSITLLNGNSAGNIAEKSAGTVSATDFGIPLELILDVPAGATGNLDFTAVPFKIRVLDVVARKVTTSSDAGDTGQLATGAGAAISNALALNVNANVLVRATSIDPANHEIAAAGTLRWIRTQSTNAACKVRVKVVRVA